MLTAGSNLFSLKLSKIWQLAQQLLNFVTISGHVLKIRCKDFMESKTAQEYKS